MENQDEQGFGPSQLEEILEMYSIGRVPLSLLLGWGPSTIQRYLNGDPISPEYGNRIRKLLNPIEMKKLLSENGSLISQIACKKAQDRVDEIIATRLGQEFEGMVFLKKLNANELGYRSGQPGKAGSFMLVPKTVINFLPTLRESVLNDSADIRITVTENGNTVDAKYIYHNSKYATADPDESRDEYRIYSGLLSDLLPEDIVLLLKTPRVQDYKMYRFRPNSEYYEILSEMIEQHKFGKSFTALVPIVALILNKIPVLEAYIPELTPEDVLTDFNEPIFINDLDTQPDQTKPLSAFSDLLAKDIHDSDIETIISLSKKIKRDARFRTAVLGLYKNKCAISGEGIYVNGLTNLEAAHIVGKGFGGSDNPTNGLALSKDYHWAFDNGLFTITDDNVVLVHEAVREIELLKRIDGKKLLLPEDESTYPSKEALAFHRKEIFGLFLKRIV